MRILWWSALALLLCLAVTSALRNQTDVTSRVSRRLPNSNRNPISANKTENAAPTSRAQFSRRREENVFRNKPTVNVSRTRSRNKSTETSSSFINLSEIQTERTEQFDSKKSYSRIRNRRPVIDEANFDTTLSREKVKSRSRQTSRYTTPQTVKPTQSLVQTSSFVETSTKTPIEITNYDDSSKSVKEVTNNQIKRRSSTLRTVETTPASRVRGRINKRTDIKPLDLEVSGTANALISAPRDPTTVRNSEIRNSRKLKYRTRQSETDTNLTGEGVTSNERKSSQTREHISSQSVLKKISRSSTENIVEQYTEKSTARTTKVIKRPVARRKPKNAVKVEKSKVSDEVSDDDNYPESFKAMIQARNASTHTSSPSSESLSVKASQKVFQTLTTTPQSFLTTPDVEKQTPLRNKLNTEDDKNNTQNNTIVIVETVATAPEESIIKPTEYRLRGTYTPRIKKIISSSGPVIEKSTPSTQRSYPKFNRKTKVITTERSIIEISPKTKHLENDLYIKKPVVRSSFYPKRNSTRNLNVNLEIPKINITEKSNGIRTFNDYKSRQILPRTSYYSRLRSSTVNVVTTTELNAKDEKNVLFADKKMENTVEVPLIYTSINSPLNTSVTLKSEKRQDDIKQSHQSFIIKVNSKESSENGTDNEIISKFKENEYERATNIVTTTQKYHAKYHDENKENGVSTLHPPIRNIQTRKFSRKPIKQREEYSLVTPKYRDRNLRKYSDTFSKTTEASSNGIIAEHDKPKSKFSSKYRASYLDKPFYKPTVPTITTSTAWLKFFVTDHHLTKSIEEPNWFDEEDLLNVTTQPMPRQNTTSPTCLHETSFQPVEGDGIQLGLDMNAISFTKTRSPLTSADLKLSESLAKPLQVMNVEASHHSPSVTVSIFDALAEILTSTTRPRISSTTEVQQNQNSNSDVKQTFDAVSSNINVNSVKDLTSQDTDISKDNVNTIAQYVQITEQTTPNVSNRMPFGGTITPSLNIEDKNTYSETAPEILPFTTTTPSPFPTTPLSARRPFAIKVLYAETEPPRDITTKFSTLNTATTDNPQMVHNTVSELILSNNKLVSSELTSMLSNNIKKIIQNMDAGSKDRLSVEMVKLLNSLIPKLQKPMTAKIDIDSFPNTTPYSLEDIKDTENIVINGNEVLSISSTNLVQNVDSDISVNSTFGNVHVNSSSSIDNFGSTSSTLGDQTTLTSIVQPTEANTFKFQNPTMEASTLSSSMLESLTNAPSVDVFINNDNSLNLNGKEFTNNNTLVPFLTNFELNDFTSIVNMTDSSNSPPSLSNVSEFALNTNSVPISSLQIRELEDIDKIEDPSQLSRLQLWILSKKARVLKMIEDLIRDHNDEIANAPLAELINDSKENNLSFSNRLSEIVNTMTTTASNSDTNRENILTSTVTTNMLETTTINPQTPLSTQSTVTFMTAGSSESIADFLTTTERFSGDAITILDDIERSSTSASDVDTTILLSTTSASNEVSTTLQAQETDTTITNLVDVTTSTNLGETTIDAESVTESSITTEKDLDSTTFGGTKTSSSSQINNVNNISNNLNIATTASIPKKDYVIFGILPNNTVVRKDPNDNVLESLTEASPYIIYGVLPNNTIIRKFPNGTRIPRIMPKIDILPISPWSLRNPYSPIHNIPAIVRPQSNPIRVSTNTVTSTDTSNNGSENRLTNDTVNTQQITMSSSALNIKDTSSLVKITTNMPPADKSTASHVLSLRTTTMLPSVDEILLNSISSATKEEMVISSMKSSTSEPRILTLDIDPETKQIRTEKPGDINGNTIFKFIPIDQVTVSDQESNVFKLGSTKNPVTLTTDIQTSTIPSVTESNTQSQIQNSITNEDLMSTIQATTEIFSEHTKSETTEPASTNSESIIPQSMMTTPVQIQTTTEEITKETSTLMTTNPTSVTAEPVTLSNITPMSITQSITSTQSSNNSPFSVTTALAEQSLETASSNQNEAELLQSLLREITRNPKNLNGFGISDRLTEISPKVNNDQLLKSVFTDGALNSKNLLNNAQTTTSRSIEDEIRQFEEDTKLLKALLQATGRNPAELNIPSLNDIKKNTRGGTVTIPPTTTRITTTITPTTTFRTTTTTSPTTTTRPTTTLQSTTMSINEDIRKLQEDTKLLKALLQATRNKNIVNLPVISGITSNVRIASNPFTTSLESNPTTSVNIRPVYTTRPLPIITTLMPGTVTVSTLQSQQQSGDEFGISTTFRPFNERSTTTTRSIDDRSTTSRSAKSGQYIVTTEMPSTSTFSDEEDLVFLQNLKSVLSTKTGNGDPETALANRVIALAVEKSLNEIQTGQVTTTNKPTMTSRTTTTTRRITTTTNPNTPSIEDDIKQFEQDTKLLQALLKATGQDPSKLNIPTLPPTNRPVAGIDLSKSSNPTTRNPYGLKIEVKDELKNEQDDAKLLQTLIKLQDAQETTTQRSKIAFTGQSSDEALKKLLKQAQPAGMLSEATKSSVSLSTEYGNSNDALLAALLKEQGFGPTTASSLDEQLRLAALLNQVVVTPKARRTTTQPPPPPPSPRRPVLDGLAWLWQQWRETGPGPGGARPNRRPSSSEKPLASSAETSSRVNWFGSGPFVGNADEKPSSNRIPLEPPSAVTEQGPGRGQLVSAAINVTRAFSQFLGAAIQGAAQTVQSVFKYGQRAATDTYTNGSG